MLVIDVVVFLSDDNILSIYSNNIERDENKSLLFINSNNKNINSKSVRTRNIIRRTEQQRSKSIK